MFVFAHINYYTHEIKKMASVIYNLNHNWYYKFVNTLEVVFIIIKTIT